VGRRADETGLHAADQWWRSAVRYLARFDRATAQVEQFLRRKGASSAQASHTVRRLIERRYLDDRAYAERWIETRMVRRPGSRDCLKAELLAKGIAESVADGAIRTALREVDEAALARRALKARQQRGRRLSPFQASRLLRQRGFEEETIKHILGEQRRAEGSDSP
jgi:regulatory protein